jgi:hypothetical protein
MFDKFATVHQRLNLHPEIATLKHVEAFIPNPNSSEIT